MTRMTFSKRWLTAFVLLAWGCFLGWMALSNTMARFLGPRTYWVVWFGAITLLATGAMSVAHASRTKGPRAGRGDWAGTALLVAPMALVIALPSSQLGAQAASRKAVGVGVLSSFVPPPTTGGSIGLEEIHYAGISPAYAGQTGIVEGLEVDLTGFVTHPKDLGDGTFSLTRFYISCCAADAVPYSVPIDADEDLEDDTWLNVTGTLERRGASFVVVPAEIKPVEEPATPYLY